MIGLFNVLFSFFYSTSRIISRYNLNNNYYLCIELVSYAQLWYVILYYKSLFASFERYYDDLFSRFVMKWSLRNLSKSEILLYIECFYAAVQINKRLLEFNIKRLICSHKVELKWMRIYLYMYALTGITWNTCLIYATLILKSTSSQAYRVLTFFYHKMLYEFLRNSYCFWIKRMCAWSM